MNIGAFTLIKNEAHWVGFSIMSAKHLVGEFVYFDGNSTDGTVELLEYLKDKYQLNIKVFKGMDPKDLQDDYVRMFNECLSRVKSDYAWFLHPDMIVSGYGKLPHDGALAFSVNTSSFAGNPGGPLYEISAGRTKKWKNLMKNDLGLHYFGHYGAHNEDMYFSEVTGDEHRIHSDFSLYPYDVKDSGIHVLHYSDVRPLERRIDRMAKCLLNQGQVKSMAEAKRYAAMHPRVSFENSKTFGKFEFKEVKDVPDVFAKYAQEFADVLGKKVEEVNWIGANHAKV